MALTDQFQIIEIPLEITVSGGNDTFTLQNLSNDVRVIGGTVIVGDDTGVLDSDDQRDLFLVEILEASKNAVGNNTTDALALNALLSAPNFPGFNLTKNSQTVFNVTHTPIGAAAILTVPFQVRISLTCVPTDVNK